MYLKPFEITPEFLDELNHVNYLNYVRMLGEVAFSELRALRGIDLQTLRDEHGLALVIAEINVKYFQQLILGDSVIVRIAPVVKIGKRLNFSAMILRANVEVAEITMSMACIDVVSGRGCRFPEHLYQHLNGNARLTKQETEIAA